MIEVVIRLIVEVREQTGAGSTGLTMLPLGRMTSIGRKQPPLEGIEGSVSTRMAKQAAASAPEGTTLKGPRTCGLLPERSQTIRSALIVTATSMRIRWSSTMPSLSMKST